MTCKWKELKERHGKDKKIEWTNGKRTIWGTWSYCKIHITHLFCALPSQSLRWECFMYLHVSNALIKKVFLEAPFGNVVPLNLLNPKRYLNWLGAMSYEVKVTSSNLFSPLSPFHLLGVKKKSYQKVMCNKFFMSNKVCSFYWTVLSDPVKRREYDKKGMLYVYDYNIIVSVSPLSLPWKMFALILCMFIHIFIYHLLAAGVSQPLQRPYIDMQWSWDKAFNMVSGDNIQRLTFQHISDKLSWCHLGGLVLCYARLQMENLPTSCNILPVHFTSTWRSVDPSRMAEWKVFYALPCLYCISKAGYN